MSTPDTFDSRMVLLGSRGDVRPVGIVARPKHCNEDRFGGECCSALRTHRETRCRNFSRPLVSTLAGVERDPLCVNRERMHSMGVHWVTIDNYGVIQFEWEPKSGIFEVVQVAPPESDGTRLIVKWANGITPSVSDWYEKGSGERDQVIREVLGMLAGYDGQNGMPV